MKLIVEQKKLRNLAALVIYKMLLDYAYLALISEMFGYMGLEKDANPLKIFLSYVFLFGLWMITPAGNYRVFDVFLNLQLLLMLVPMLTIYGATNGSSIYLLMVLLCYFIQCLCGMLYKEHACVTVSTASMNFNNILLLAAGAVVCICILIYGIPSLTALDITRVYEIRSEYVLRFPLNYLVSWCAKIIIPLGIILSLEEKCYGKAALYAGLQLILYLSFAHKTYLFMIFLVSGVWFVIRKKWLYGALYAVFPTGVFCSILIYKVLGNILAISYFVRRVLIVPAFLKFTYYEYFSVHPKAYFYGSVIGKILGTKPYYNKSIAAEIGAYMGSPDVMANTGYLGESYAQGGYFALILFSIVIIGICKMYSLKKNMNMEIFLSMFIVWFYTLNDVAMQTSLLTGGGLILLLLFVMWPEKYQSGQSSGYARIRLRR